MPRTPLRIHIQVAAEFKAMARGDWMRKAARAAVQAAVPPVPEAHPMELSLRVTDDAALRELNRTYRGLDKPTDVLSFGDEDWRDGVRVAAGTFLTAPDAGAEYLGDIVLSMEKCQAQALKAGHPVAHELALLVIHGVLHLLGHDHDTRIRKTLMWQRQAAALQLLGIAVRVA